MIDLSVKPFDESKTYSAYKPENVYKCTINNINDVFIYFFSLSFKR